jgi:hypothetical protein
MWWPKLNYLISILTPSKSLGSLNPNLILSRPSFISASSTITSLANSNCLKNFLNAKPFCT